VPMYRAHRRFIGPNTHPRCRHNSTSLAVIPLLVILSAAKDLGPAR
jgi:hypothetical protein